MGNDTNVVNATMSTQENGDGTITLTVDYLLADTMSGALESSGDPFCQLIAAAFHRFALREAKRTAS